ncbi:alpha-L-fucosidase [Pedobacter nyackensis]|uniref:alpha-L-fucosidase n=1 Tax=Pedobacter nyackensis TaxID=475255 RepID=UPI00292D31A4|nr:alpha-L-fucosidase [Pedobacter nyackensis]
MILLTKAKKIYLLLISTVLLCLAAHKKEKEPAPYGPIPTERQIRWQELEFYAFIHFSINSFTDVEWGYGDKDPQIFNPTNLDCKQWCKIIKDAGMKGVILTAKHHDGFCLWPSAYTDYDIQKSPWKNGKGDLVKELAEACKAYDLKLGIYLSPWDRNNKDYGTALYPTYFRNQLKELLTNYGDIFEVWFDGANGGSGYYGGANETRNVDRKTYYNWPQTNKLVHELQPNAVIFSDGGPDVRWCGNESGWVGETNWSTLRRDEVWPGWPLYEQLQNGHEDGNYWVPAEVNVSIRPGWFYHKEEDNKVRSVDQLLDIYYNSIGRNGTWNLNIPIDRRGLVHPADSAALTEFAQVIRRDLKDNLAKRAKVFASNTRGATFSAENLIDGNKDSYWATEDKITKASLTIELGKEPIIFNRLLIQEHIRLGQRIKSFTVDAYVNGQWQPLDSQTTIGYKRILKFPDTKASKIRINLDAKAPPTISNIEIYNAPKRIHPPSITRNKDGIVSIKSNSTKTKILYSLNGGYPDMVYKKPFETKANVVVKAMIIDTDNSNRSEIQTKNFNIDKRKWKVLNIPELSVNKIFDGDGNTSWISKDSKLPFDLIVDLGKEQDVNGFKYLPDQNAKGVVFNYTLSSSSDGKTWKTIFRREFDNIGNNPVMQIVPFEPKKMRFIKFTANSNVKNSSGFGCAEFDISTINNSNTH